MSFKVDFIIPGVQKAGTTSAAYYLDRHSNIYLPQKELHFFNQHYNNGMPWYEEQFKIPRNFCGLLGERSPRYCVIPEVMDRIKETYPDIKIILCLRDPVTRLYSQWNMEIDRRLHRSPFLEFINSGPLKPLKLTKYESYPNIKPLDRGFYAKQVKHIVTLFGRKNLYICIAERFIKNTFLELNTIFNFLGVERMHKRNFKRNNKHVRQYKKSIRKQDRELCKEIYRQSTHELFDFIGYEIEEWDV